MLPVHSTAINWVVTSRRMRRRTMVSRLPLSITTVFLLLLVDRHHMFPNTWSQPWHTNRHECSSGSKHRVNHGIKIITPCTNTRPTDDRCIVKDAHKASNSRNSPADAHVVPCQHCKDPETDVNIKEAHITLKMGPPH